MNASSSLRPVQHRRLHDTLSVFFRRKDSPYSVIRAVANGCILEARATQKSWQDDVTRSGRLETASIIAMCVDSYGKAYRNALR